jgi:hypothetical protein
LYKTTLKKKLETYLCLISNSVILMRHEKLSHLVDKMIETVKISLEYDLPNFREETLLLSAIENILNNENRFLSSLKVKNFEL